jgi:hypothetical protein
MRLLSLVDSLSFLGHPFNAALLKMGVSEDSFIDVFIIYCGRH